MTQDSFNPLSGALLVGGGYRDAIANQLRAVGVKPEDSDALATELASQSKIYLSLNPRYDSGKADFRSWAGDHGLHPTLQDPERFGIPSLYKHQEEAVLAIRQGRHTLITAGTGTRRGDQFVGVIAGEIQFGGFFTDREIERPHLYPGKYPS